MVSEFHDKHVVVSGGTGALGAAVCQHLVDRGATCHVPSRRAFAPDEFPLLDHDRVTVTAGIDLTDEGAISSFFDRLPSLWATVNVAGGFAMSAITETGLEQFDHMMTTNATSCFLSCRESVRRMRAGSGGRIVNVAARIVVEPAGGMVAYSASKAAVAAITRALAAEVGTDGIFVNAILPSIIDTPKNREAMPDADFSSWPKPAEIAEAIAFLVSPVNRVTNGALVPVYGNA